MNDIQQKLDKILANEIEFEINIIDESCNIVGLLKPITSRHLNCNEILSTTWGKYGKPNGCSNH